MEYEIGKFYDFVALHFFDEFDGVTYLALNAGGGNAVKVRPYDFQTEWNDVQGKTIKCYCKGISRNGNYYFEQSYYDILSQCYSEDQEEVFAVVDVCTDPTTGNTFYKLLDPYGLQHRYYTNIQMNLHDSVTLTIAKVVDGDGNKAHIEFKPLVGSNPTPGADAAIKVSQFGVENFEREFKSTIVFPAGEIFPDIKKQLSRIMRSLAGFMNAEGGTLYIGVNDAGQVCGINDDFVHLNDDNFEIEEDEGDYTWRYQQNCDGYELKIRKVAQKILGQTAASALNFDFKEENGMIYCIVTVDKVHRPVYFWEKFIFERQGNMTSKLKGEAITYFIEKRLSLHAGQQQASTPPATKATIVGTDVDKSKTIEVATGTEEQAEPSILYVTFYKDGKWSWQKDEMDNPDTVVCNIPVTKKDKSNKESRIIQCYDNGCMNVVALKDYISMKKNTEYSNGWNTDAIMIAAFCADAHDQIAFFSKDEDGREWVKVHYATCVKVHGANSKATKGNVIVNPKHDNAKPTCIKLIDKKYTHLISALCFNDNETSTTLGVKTNNHQYSAPIGVLKKICNLE